LKYNFVFFFKQKYFTFEFGIPVALGKIDKNVLRKKNLDVFIKLCIARTMLLQDVSLFDCHNWCQNVDMSSHFDIMSECESHSDIMSKWLDISTFWHQLMIVFSTFLRYTGFLKLNSNVLHIFLSLIKGRC